MKREVLLAAMVVVSLGLSAFSLMLQWVPKGEEPVYIYNVKAYTDERCRIYVFVNSQTVIADEFMDYKLYPVYAVKGDVIDIHGYSAMPFTITLDKGFTVASQTANEIEISYTVPGD